MTGSGVQTLSFIFWKTEVSISSLRTEINVEIQKAAVTWERLATVIVAYCLCNVTYCAAHRVTLH